MATFRLDHTADINRTHKIGHIELIPKRLVEQFGPPRRCDEYKVSGQWTFVDEYGGPSTLYDWKLTSLYFDIVNDWGAPALPTPEEFWAQETPETLSIGGRSQNDVEAFKAWGIKELAGS